MGKLSPAARAKQSDERFQLFPFFPQKKYALILPRARLFLGKLSRILLPFFPSPLSVTDDGIVKFAGTEKDNETRE